MKKIKILAIVDNLNKCDGIASYVMNYYKELDHNKISMDFLVSKYDNNVDSEYKNIIEKTGGKLILKSNITNSSIVKEIKNINIFFKNNHYDIVHSHIINMGYFYLKYARKNGVKVRILHSHSTFLWSKNLIKKLRNKLFTYLTIKNANTYFACSQMAGEFLFKKREFYLIKNAIYTDKFRYNEKIRKQYRKELNIDDKTVYGHVGRFNIQKNHQFLLDVFEEIVKINKKSVLLLIGKGELESEIRKTIESKNLQNNVIILGERSDINNLFQSMDIFLLPSLFEGLPVVGVEAQTSDLQCIFSDKITKEVKLLDKTLFLNIKNKFDWVDTIQKINIKKQNRKNVTKEIQNVGYDIQHSATQLANIYINILNGEK